MSNLVRQLRVPGATATSATSGWAQSASVIGDCIVIVALAPVRDRN